MSLNSNIINVICDGDLDELKKIPKFKITVELSKKMTSIMEEKLININDVIENNYESSDIGVSTYHYLDKRKRIEDCILYLKKIE
jgi:hypothetical protein